MNTQKTIGRSGVSLWHADQIHPSVHVRFDQQLTQSDLRREVAASQWVVDTARIQQDMGDPDAELSHTTFFSILTAADFIAAYAIFDWAAGRYDCQKMAANEDFWRWAA
jgi:hypothetical protein